MSIDTVKITFIVDIDVDDGENLKDVIKDLIIEDGSNKGYIVSYEQVDCTSLIVSHDQQKILNLERRVQELESALEDFQKGF